VVLATKTFGKSSAAELPVDDAIINKKYQGGRMMRIWQKRANRALWLTVERNGTAVMWL
jgi:hypothetical protein